MSDTSTGDGCYVILTGAVRTLSAVLGYGSSLALAMGVFDYTGGSLKTIWKDVGLDEVSRKEIIRATRQRPVEELVSQIVETPSEIPHLFTMAIKCTHLVLTCFTVVHGPEYEERRKERLKEKYGIVVHE